MLHVFTVMYTVSLYKCEFARIHKVVLMQLLSQTRNNKLNKIANVYLSDVCFCGRDACLPVKIFSGHCEVLFLKEFLGHFSLSSEI